MITAKVRCSTKNVVGEGENRYADVSFTPDYADGRNKEWAWATPGLSLAMRLNDKATDLFEHGKAYTLQFVETED